MITGAEALINLGALRNNFSIARKAAPASRILAVIKANAYGHGIERAALTLADADAFAVARLEEARAVRAANIRQPLVLLEGFLDEQELATIADAGFEVVVHRSQQVDLLAGGRGIRPLRVWLKVDTGMHRLGLAPADAVSAYQRLRRSAVVADEPRIMTHLANADNRCDDATEQQLRCFTELTDTTGGERSAANSAAVLAWPESHLEWIRPGIMLYGASPFIDDTAQSHGLQPVMTLRARLIAVRRLAKGEAVGYGGTWVCPEAMPVGVVAIGYGDGYPRHAQSGTPLLVDDTPVALIGRVSMDMLCVDLRNRPHTQVGDIVTLWGDGLPVEEIAQQAGTIPYQLLCGLTRRVAIVEH